MEENVTLQSKRYLQRKILLKITWRSLLVTIQEQVNQIGNQKICGNSRWQYNQTMTQKRIQSNCKIYVKTFSRARVSCVEDYVKPSLENPSDHFILHVGMNDLSSKKCSMEITELIHLACRLKDKMHDVRVSTIILRTDDKKLNRFLINNSRKIKTQHLTSKVNFI